MDFSSSWSDLSTTNNGFLVSGGEDGAQAACRLVKALLIHIHESICVAFVMPVRRLLSSADGRNTIKVVFALCLVCVC